MVNLANQRNGLHLKVLAKFSSEKSSSSTKQMRLLRSNLKYNNSSLPQTGRESHTQELDHIRSNSSSEQENDSLYQNIKVLSVRMSSSGVSFNVRRSLVGPLDAANNIPLRLEANGMKSNILLKRQNEITCHTNEPVYG